MKRELVVPFVLTGLMIFSACSEPHSLNPLSDPAEATIDEEIIGTWTGFLELLDETILLHFIPGENRLTDIVVVAYQEGQPGSLGLARMFPTVINGDRYMNVMWRELTDDYSSNPDRYPTYYFYKYQFLPENALKLWSFSATPVREAINKGIIKGRLPSYKDPETNLPVAVFPDEPVITDSSKNIVNFFQSIEDDELFELIGTFRKIDIAFP